MERIDRYELREELGRGGLGVVYRAHDPLTGEDVALKVLTAAARLDPESLARFRNEALAASELVHPSIVRTRDAGVASGHPFIAMDLAPGGSLAGRVARGPLPQVEAARLVERVARALAYAHDRGVIHRDVKPANVLLDAAGAPLLTDFGMARLSSATRLTQSGDVMGTPAYMAPEQASGDSRRAGPWSDVYALGATLYELLSGRPPFVGTSALATLEQVLSAEPEPLRRARPDVDRALEAICQRAMAKTAARRYLSATDLADALGAWLERDAVTTRRAARPAALAALALVVVAVVVGGVAAWRSAATDRPSAAAPAPAPERQQPAESLDPALTRRLDELLGLRATGEVAAALVLADALVVEHPGAALAWSARSEVQLARRSWEDAVADADRAIALDGANPLHALRRGRARLRRGDFELAREDARRALEAPAPAPALRLAAQQLLEQAEVALTAREAGERDDLGSTREVFDRLVEAQPLVAHAWVMRARLFAVQGDGAAALDDLDRALALDPYLVDALLARVPHVPPLEGLSTVERALKVVPGDAEVLQARARALYLLERRDEAFAALADVARAEARTPAQLTSRAEARLAHGEDEAALTDLDEALRHAPDAPRPLYLRGHLRRLRGDPRGAIEDLERLLERSGSIRASTTDQVRRELDHARETLENAVVPACELGHPHRPAVRRD